MPQYAQRTRHAIPQKSAKKSTVWNQATLHHNGNRHQRIKRCSRTQNVTILGADAAIFGILGGTNQVKNAHEQIVDFGQVNAIEDFNDSRSIVCIEVTLTNKASEIIECIKCDATISRCRAATDEQ